jgi:hypothetical protein
LNKYLKNIGLKVPQIISPPGVPTCLGPALHRYKIKMDSKEARSEGVAWTGLRIVAESCGSVRDFLTIYKLLKKYSVVWSDRPTVDRL